MIRWELCLFILEKSNILIYDNISKIPSKISEDSKIWVFDWVEKVRISIIPFLEMDLN
jgi:hypothetical protein